MIAAPPSGSDDATLAVAAAGGDRAAFAAIYDRYADRLHDFSVGMLRDRDAAADCVQDTFVTAATKLGQLREPERLRPWLYAIARSECMSRLRLRQREHLSEDLPDMPADDADLATVAARSELAVLIASASGGLTDRDRAVLELAYRQGLDGPDLADALGVTARNANTLVERMRDTVARSLGALLVCRRVKADPGRCPELAELLAGWDGEMTVLLRKRAARHIESCPTCSEERGRLVTPAALLGSAPVVIPAPGWLRGQTLDQIELPGSAQSSESWWPDEDFDISDLPGGPARPRTRIAAGASLVMIGIGGAILLAQQPQAVPVVPVRTTAPMTAPSAVSVASVPPAPSSSASPSPSALPRSAPPSTTTVTTQAPTTTDAPVRKPDITTTPPTVSETPVTTSRTTKPQPQPQHPDEEEPDEATDNGGDDTDEPGGPSPQPDKPAVPSIDQPPPVDKSPDEECTPLNPCEDNGPPVFS